MAYKRFDVHYLDESRPVDRVTLGAGETILCKRDCAARPEADDEYRSIYMVWLAAKREGKATETFDAWCQIVGDIDPVITVEQLDELYATGGIEQAVYERMKAYVSESGESRTPLSK